MAAGWLEALKVIGGVALGGGGVSAWFASRKQARAQMITSQASLGEMLNQQTQLLLQEAAKDRRDFKARANRQERRIASLEREVSQCNAKHKDCEDGQAELREQIKRLVAEAPVATYPNEGANASD